jgi:hypothetical protein
MYNIFILQRIKIYVGAVMEERMKKSVEKEKTYQVLLNYLSTQPDA